VVKDKAREEGRGRRERERVGMYDQGLTSIYAARYNKYRQSTVTAVCIKSPGYESGKVVRRNIRSMGVLGEGDKESSLVSTSSKGDALSTKLITIVITP
jgi:hypothetical protein